MFLQHLPKKKPLIVTLIAVLIGTGIIGYYFFGQNIPSVAAWWNEGWHYRKLIPITNSGSTLTDYQISFTLDTAALITAGKMQSDCDDLRLTDYQGQILPYWIEENNPGCNNAATRVWTKISSLPSGTTNIFAYYGNSQAASLQKGSDVFTFFDDFNSSILDSSKWTIYTGSPTLSSGYINFAAGTDSGIKSVNTSWLGSGNYSIETLQRIVSGSNTFNFGVSDSFSGTEPGASENDLQLCLTCGNTTWRFRNQGNIDYCSNAKDTENQWRVSQINYIAGTSAAAYNYSNNRGTTTQTCTTSTSLPTMTGFNTIHFKSFTKDANVDWVFVRKFAATEPTIGSLGSEEKGQGPVGYWRFEEGQGTTTADATTSGNTGTLNGGASWQDESQCISGKCLYYDGTDDYVSVEVNQFSSITGSVSIWVKPVTGLSNSSMIFGHQNGNNRLYIGSDAWPRIKLGLADNGNIDSGKDIVYNTWQHLLLTYNSGTWVFYYNGEQVSTGAYTGSITFLSPEIGDDGGSSWTNNFKGFIDEVKMYDYARSATQIKQDYSAGLAGSGASAGAAAVLGGKNQKWLTDGLVGYWKMDETSWTNDCSTGSVIDSSGNGNNGKACPASTGPTGGTVGKFGNGGSFDGSDDYIALTSSVLSGNNDFTISTWVNSTNFTNTNRFFSQGSETCNNHFWLGTETTTGNLQWGFWCNDKTTSTALTAGNWYHIVVVKSGANSYGYVNGVQVDSFNQGTVNIGNTTPYIGRISPTHAHKMAGKIDETRIYNRSLSGQEVADLYSWAPGPVGYWKFDENTGTTAYDSSGNGFNSTSFSGSPAWKPGKHGSALDFTGTSKYVALPTMTGKYGSALTVSAWVYHTASSNWDDIVAGTCGDILFGFSNNYLSFGGQCNSPMTMTSYNTNINDAWHYVTGTYDGATSRLYVDGIQVASASKSGTFTPSSLQISRTGEDFQGKIDEVKIYNYARTPRQILEDMNSGQGKPISYWNFDEPKWSGTSGEVKDISGNGHNGTAQGGVTTAVGKYGRAGNYLDNGDYITTTGNISTSDGITVSAWIYPTDRSYRTIARIGNQAGTSFHWLYLQSSSIAWQYANGTNYIAKTASYSMPLNQWSHLLVTHDYNLKTIKFYVNGTLVGTQTHTDTVSPITDKVVTIGAYTAGDGVFAGLLDELKIYNYALPESDVKNDYNQNSAIALGSGTEPGSTGNVPVAWWKLDDNTGTAAVDSSGNGNTGTLTNGPTWTVGKLGSAVKFDGNNDQISSTFGGVTIGTDSITVSTWVKLSSMPTINPRIVSFAQDANNGFSLVAYGGSGYNSFVWEVKKAGSVYGAGLSSAVYNSNQWYHLEGTFDNSTNTVKLYMNGVLVSGGGGSLSLPPVTGTVFIGSKSSDSFLYGLVDDVKIYNYTRSQAQVAYDYNRGKPVGHWALDEGDGKITRDFSGNTNNGTITIGGSGSQTTVAQAWSSGSTGKYGKSLNFDNTDDYITVTSNSTINMTTDMSIGLWLKRTSTGGAQTRTNLLFKLQTGTDPVRLGYSLDISNSTNKLEAWWGINTGYNTHTSNTAITDTNWHHIMVTRSAGQVYLYIDGKLDSSNTFSETSWNASTQDLLISGNIWARNSANGQLDDIRIYNYALTADQIKQVMQEGSAVRF